MVDPLRNRERRFFPPVTAPVPREHRADRASADRTWLHGQDYRETYNSSALLEELSRSLRFGTCRVGPEPVHTPYGDLSTDPRDLSCTTNRWARGLGVDEALRRVDDIERGIEAKESITKKPDPDARRVVEMMRRELRELRDLRDQYIPAFQEEAVRTAELMLARSRSKASSVIERYGLGEDDTTFGPDGRRRVRNAATENADTAALRSSATELVARSKELGALESKVQVAKAAPDGKIDGCTVGQWQSRLDLARQGYRERLLALGKEHAVLLDVHAMGGAEARLEKLAGDRFAIGEALSSYNKDVLAAIDRTEARIHDDPSNVFRLPPLVEATKRDLGVEPGSMGGGFADEAVRNAAADQRAMRDLLTLAAVSLSVAAAMPSGGASLTALAVLSSGMDLVSLSASFEEYSFQRDAASTDPNSERAMLKEHPSTFWMFLEAAGALLSAGATIRALTKSRFVRLLARTDELGDVARRQREILGQERATELFNALGAKRFVELGRELPGDLLLQLLEHHSAETVGWALRDLSVFETKELLAKLDAPLAEKISSQMSARAFRSASFDLGPALASEIAKSADATALLRVHDKWGQQLRAYLVELKNGTISLDGGPAVSVAAFAKLPRETAERLARYPAIADLSRASSAQIIDFVNAVEVKMAKDKAAIPGALQKLPQDLRRAAQETADSVLKAQPRLKPPPTPRQAHKVDSEFAAAAEYVDVPSPGQPAKEPWASKFFADPKYSVEAKRAVSGAIARAQASGRFEREGLHRWMEGVQRAGNDNQVKFAFAEIDHALNVLDEGRLAVDSQVILGAKRGGKYSLTASREIVLEGRAGQEIMGEVDVLYLGADGKIHADEVKSAAEALTKKIDEVGASGRGRSEYLERMQRWQGQASDRAATVVIVSDEKWSVLMGKRIEDASTLELLDDHGIGLEISGARLSPADCRHLLNTLKHEANLDSLDLRNVIKELQQ